MGQYLVTIVIIIIYLKHFLNRLNVIPILHNIYFQTRACQIWSRQVDRARCMVYGVWCMGHGFVGCSTPSHSRIRKSCEGISELLVVWRICSSENLMYFCAIERFIEIVGYAKSQNCEKWKKYFGLSLSVLSVANFRIESKSFLPFVTLSRKHAYSVNSKARRTNIIIPKTYY
jgi:hypothetical protein